MSFGWGQDCDENMYWTDCGLPFECNPTCSNPNPLPGCMTMCEILIVFVMKDIFLVMTYLMNVSL